MEEPEAPQKNQQVTQQVGDPEAPLNGGNQWPPYSIWYQVATIRSVWAPVEDWEVVDSLSDNTEKVLQMVSSHLPKKATWTIAGTARWIFLTALKVNMDQ